MDEYKKLLSDCKDYLQIRYDLLRLELLDKLSWIIGLIVFVIVGSFLVMGAVAFFSVALVDVLDNMMPTWVACLILGALLLVILAILYSVRERLFINPFVKLLSSLLFSTDEETTESVVKKEENNETNE